MTTMNIPALLHVSDLAAEKAAGLLQDKGFADGALRVFVVGGGCSGYQYGMALATEAEPRRPGDRDRRRPLPRRPRQRAAADRRPRRLRDDIMKQGFSITNPNAAKSCACGTSFDTADSAGASQARSCV